MSGATLLAYARAKREDDHSHHLDDTGAARMVDVSAKPDTQRRAVASGRIAMSAEAAAAIRDGDGRQG